MVNKKITLKNWTRKLTDFFNKQTKNKHEYLN